MACFAAAWLPGIAFQRAEADPVPPGNHQQSEVAFLAWWSVFHNQESLLLRCVVRREDIDSEDAIGDVLTIYKKKDSLWEEVFTFGEGDSFLGAFPMAEAGGHLVTLWVAGSAYRVRVLVYADGLVKLVLDTGSRMLPPEIIYREVGKKALIVITDLEWVKRETMRERLPLTARVYGWDGTGYKLEATVPWKDRLRLNGGSPQ